MTEKGKKHILGLWQGETENAEVCKGLISDMVRRGLETTRQYLFVVDGAKALSKAIKDTLGTSALIQLIKDGGIPERDKSPAKAGRPRV